MSTIKVQTICRWPVWPPNQISGVWGVGLDVQRQLGSVLLSAFDEWPPNHRLVPPYDTLGWEDQLELELSNERKQKAFHPAG